MCVAEACSKVYFCWKNRMRTIKWIDMLLAAFSTLYKIGSRSPSFLHTYFTFSTIYSRGLINCTLIYHKRYLRECSLVWRSWTDQSYVHLFKAFSIEDQNFVDVLIISTINLLATFKKLDYQHLSRIKQIFNMCIFSYLDWKQLIWLTVEWPMAQNSSYIMQRWTQLALEDIPLPHHIYKHALILSICALQSRLLAFLKYW